MTSPTDAPSSSSSATTSLPNGGGVATAAATPAPTVVAASIPEKQEVDEQVMEKPKAIKRGMEPAFTTRLRTAAVDDYRKKYQRFRSGKAHGASGEGPTGHRSGEEEEEEEEEAKEAEEIDEDTSVLEAENTRLYQRVADFRRQYRSYRVGAAKGVRSDASRKITLEEAKVTPVGQLSAFLRTQVAPSLGTRRVVSTLNFAHRSTFHAHIGAGRLGLASSLLLVINLGPLFLFSLLLFPSYSYFYGGGRF
ncbi:hypothetical protein VYU27_007742 [Nannochloropsis oceanica]